MMPPSNVSQFLRPDRLKPFMGAAAGYLLALSLLELFPESIEAGPHLAGKIFLASLLTILAFDYWVTPRLDFLERLFIGSPGSGPEDFIPITSPKAGASTLAPIHNIRPTTNTHHVHHHPHHGACGHAVFGFGAACSVVGCLLVCSFFDGIALGSSFAQQNLRQLLLLIAGQCFHMIPEITVTYAVLVGGGVAPRRALWVLLLVSLALSMGFAIPMMVPIPMPAAWLAVSAGILLYVAMSQMLPMALEVKHGPLYVFAGALVFVLLGHA